MHEGLVAGPRPKTALRIRSEPFVHAARSIHTGAFANITYPRNPASPHLTESRPLSNIGFEALREFW